MKNILIILLVFVAFQATAQFKIQKNIKTKVIIEDIPAMIIGYIFLTDSLLITQDVRAKEDYIKIYDYKNDNLYISFGKTGRGPNEMITPLLNGLSDDKQQLVLFDPNMKKIHYCNLTSFSDKPDKIIDLKESGMKFIFNAMPINNDLFLARGILEKGLFATFRLSEKGKYTEHGEFSFQPADIKKNQLYELNKGVLYLSPDKKYLVFTAMHFGYIACYKIENDNFLKVWDYWVSKPKYKVNNGRVNWKQANLMGFMNIAITDNHIYAVYNEEDFREFRSNSFNSPSSIMKFSLRAGTPEAIYKTDVPIIRIAANEEGEVYCIAKNPGYNLVELLW